MRCIENAIARFHHNNTETETDMTSRQQRGGRVDCIARPGVVNPKRGPARTPGVRQVRTRARARSDARVPRGGALRTSTSRTALCGPVPASRVRLRDPRTAGAAGTSRRRTGRPLQIHDGAAAHFRRLRRGSIARELEKVGGAGCVESPRWSVGSLLFIYVVIVYLQSRSGGSIASIVPPPPAPQPKTKNHNAMP